jgi:hypothetical protein
MYMYMYVCTYVCSLYVFIDVFIHNIYHLAITVGIAAVVHEAGGIALEHGIHDVAYIQIHTIFIFIFYF